MSWTYTSIGGSSVVSSAACRKMRSRSSMSAFHLDQENAIAELTSAIWRYSRYSAAAFYHRVTEHSDYWQPRLLLHSETTRAFSETYTKQSVILICISLPCPGSWHIWMNLQPETRWHQLISFSARNTKVTIHLAHTAALREVLRVPQHSTPIIGAHIINSIQFSIQQWICVAQSHRKFLMHCRLTVSTEQTVVFLNSV